MKTKVVARKEPFRIAEPRTDNDGIKIVLSQDGDSVIFFHVNVQLSTHIQGPPSMEKEPRVALVHDIMSIEGVQHMYVDRYKVKVERTLAIDWDGIVPKVDAAIREAAKKIIAAQK